MGMSLDRGCGVCGGKFEVGDQVMRNEIPASGESEAYMRIVHPKCINVPEEEVQKLIDAGEIKIIE